MPRTFSRPLGACQEKTLIRPHPIKTQQCNKRILHELNMASISTKKDPLSRIYSELLVPPPQMIYHVRWIASKKKNTIILLRALEDTAY